MRVLLTCDFYPPHVGGVELQVQALGRELARRGHSVHVATVAQSGLPPETTEDGVTVHRLRALTTRVSWFSGDERRRYHPPFPDPELAFRMRRLIARIQPDVIQAHGWIAYSCALAAVGRTVPLILSVRDYGYTCPTRNLLLHGRICSGPAAAKCFRHSTEWYGRGKGLAGYLGVFLGRPLLRRRVGAAHAVSRYVSEVIRRDLLYGLDRSVEIIPDIVLGGPADGDATRRGAGGPAQRSMPAGEAGAGLSAARHPATGAAGPGDAADDATPRSATPAAAATGRVTEAGVVPAPDSALPAGPYILFVGALQSHKGVATLLDAYQGLRDAPPLVLIGTSWPDTPKEFPPGVTVITDAPHSVVMAAWERALFGVAPSIWPDPLPGVVREAMIAGRPVVGSAVGGIVDMIADGENGLLVPGGDPVALAAAMQRLVDDPELAGRLGAAARRSAGEFDADRIAERFEVLYERLANEAPRRARRTPAPAVLPARIPASPRRIHITGGSGSGKSSLAIRLSRQLAIPAYHLDELARDPVTGARRPIEERRQFVHDIATSTAWVTEGIHVGWTDELFRDAEVVVWLDHLDWPKAAARVFRRFIHGWLTETRRRGWRDVFRFRQYARHLAEFIGAVGEIRRYETAEEAITDDAGSHQATLEQVAPYASKLVHCRRPSDVVAFVATLAAHEASPNPIAEGVRTGSGVR